jgi:glycine/D-amino acid oxidase-like deaminating enzyme/nitrite reductase/ring-hydroxylating ferredoxin subunit
MPKSIWQGTTTETSFQALTGFIETDVVIIGGGITGISAAMLLAKGGKRVVLLEAHRVGSGTTGCSTGNLHVLPDQYLQQIGRKWGRETAAAVVASRGQALQLLEGAVAEFGLDCDFQRQPHYLLARDEAQQEQIEAEHAAALAAGLEATLVEGVPLPFPTGKSLRIEGQAQFHPLRFVQQLSAAIASESCCIFENSPVLEIDSKKMAVKTPTAEVRGAVILMATHTPKGFNVLHTELGPYREYGIAGPLPDAEVPEGICWTLEEPSHSIRAYEEKGSPYLIIIGEKHKTGQHGHEEYFRRVEEFAYRRFGLERIDYRWSAQNYRPADDLPYIGRTIAAENIHIATGFGTNGLLYGPLAAMIFADALLERPNPWASMYRGTRLTPKGAGKFIEENVDVAMQYLKDYLTGAEKEKLQDVPLGGGKVVELEGKRIAVYRDEQDNWSAVSPVCTHLGCIVHWNAMEKSWDCPCHGSRFNPDGSIIEGPALQALGRREMRLEEG